MSARPNDDDFVVYKGEEVVAIGTAEECAEKLGKTREHVLWLSYPSAHKRALEPGSLNMVAERVRANELIS